MPPPSLLERIDAFLSHQSPIPSPSRPVNEGLVHDQAVADKLIAADPLLEERAKHVREVLSGTFGEAIEVYLGEGDDAGAYLVQVPAERLKSSGLRIIESIVRPRVGSLNKGSGSAAVTGSAEAIQNAERRVAKPLGEGWAVALDSFAAHVGAPAAFYFRVARKG